MKSLLLVLLLALSCNVALAGTITVQEFQYFDPILAPPGYQPLPTDFHYRLDDQQYWTQVIEHSFSVPDNSTYWLLDKNEVYIGGYRAVNVPVKNADYALRLEQMKFFGELLFREVVVDSGSGAASKLLPFNFVEFIPVPEPSGCTLASLMIGAIYLRRFVN